VSAPDSRERFSSQAALYARYRPSYPPELYHWILATAGVGPGASALDLACGTGLSTRPLAELGLEVVGIDPNEKMLAEAVAEGGARYARGESTATGLPDQSVDLVTVAQAFHWLDIPATLREIHRVLRPGRSAVAYWNIRDLSPGFMSEYDDSLRRFSREYAIIDKPIETSEQIRRAEGVRDVREAEFGYRQDFDLEGFLGRVYSSSYVVHGVKDHEPFRRELRATFERHARAGRIEFRYRTIALAWRLGFS